MNWLPIITISITCFALLYIVLYYRISKLLEKKFEKKYRIELEEDMQEFYREMESYSSLLSYKIKGFQSLLYKQETNIRQWKESTSWMENSTKVRYLTEILEDIEKKDPKILSLLEFIKENIHHLQLDKNSNTASYKKNSLYSISDVLQDELKEKKIDINQNTITDKKNNSKEHISNHNFKNVTKYNQHENLDIADSFQEIIQDDKNDIDTIQKNFSKVLNSSSKIKDNLQELASNNKGQKKSSNINKDIEKNTNTSTSLMLTQAMKKIGNAIMPMIRYENNNNSISAHSSKQIPQEKIKIFQNTLEKKMQEIRLSENNKKTIEPTQEFSSEQKSYKNQNTPLEDSSFQNFSDNQKYEYSNNKQSAQSNSDNHPPDHDFQKLHKNEGDIIKMIENLHSSTHKHVILKELLEKNVPLEEISEKSNIPISQLSAIRSIYNI